MRFFVLIMAVFLFVPGEAHARWRKPTKDFQWVVQLRGEFPLTSSAADNDSGATYTTKFSEGFVVGGGIGVLLYRNWLLTLNFDHWLAKRVFMTGGPVQEDTLNYQTVGGEIGFLKERDRMYFLFSAGLNYPLNAEIQSTTGTFSPVTSPLAYFARVQLGIHFSSLHSFAFYAGYRFANLGALNNGGAPYLAGAADFDLSGFFGGLALTFQF